VSTIVEPRALPGHFYAFAVSCALGTLGLMTFGVISYHLVDTGLVRTAVVPLIYAAAMATEAVAALVTGFAYDRWGPAILFTLPALIVAVPPCPWPTRWFWCLRGCCCGVR
jgi:MFS family permease